MIIIIFLLLTVFAVGTDGKPLTNAHLNRYTRTGGLRMATKVRGGGTTVLQYKKTKTQEPEMMPEGPSRLNIVSANIDGLCDPPYDPVLCAKVAAKCIIQSKPCPHVVHLQEVTPATIGILISEFGRNNFRLAIDKERDVLKSYFTVTFVRNDFKIIDAYRTSFNFGAAKSGMGRDMLVTTFQAGGKEVMSINSHLESMKDESAKRTAQLEMCLLKITEHEGPAFLGGDLNMRDSEVKTVKQGGNVKQNFFDAFEASGKPAAHSVTWPGPRNKAYLCPCRFDRLFGNARGRWVDFQTFGKEEHVDLGGKTYSDHFSIKCTLTFDGEVISQFPLISASNEPTSDSNKAAPSKEEVRQKRLLKYGNTHEETKPAPSVPSKLSSFSPTTSSLSTSSAIQSSNSSFPSNAAACSVEVIDLCNDDESLEWVCSVCTLINETTSETCSVCDTVRISMKRQKSH